MNISNMKTPPIIVGAMGSQSAVKKGATTIWLEKMGVTKVFIVDIGGKNGKPSEAPGILQQAKTCRDQGKTVAVLFAFDPPVDPNEAASRKEQPYSEVSSTGVHFSESLLDKKGKPLAAVTATTERIEKSQIEAEKHGVPPLLKKHGINNGEIDFTIASENQIVEKDGECRDVCITQVKGKTGESTFAVSAQNYVPPWAVKESKERGFGVTASEIMKEKNVIEDSKNPQLEITGSDRKEIIADSLKEITRTDDDPPAPADMGRFLSDRLREQRIIPNKTLLPTTEAFDEKDKAYSATLQAHETSSALPLTAAGQSPTGTPGPAIADAPLQQASWAKMTWGALRNMKNVLSSCCASRKPHPQRRTQDSSTSPASPTTPLLGGSQGRR
jgi:hypothetical protein